MTSRTSAFTQNTWLLSHFVALRRLVHGLSPKARRVQSRFSACQAPLGAGAVASAASLASSCMARSK